MQSEQINELADALAKAQSEMNNAPLNKTNPHFKSKYADLASIRDAVIPALSKHGLALMQYTVNTDAGLALRTRLAHSSGQWIEGEYPLPVVLDKPQAMGSALTYAKRYGMATMVGISADEDDDANAAQGAAKPEKQAPSPAENKAKEIADALRAADNVAAIDALWADNAKHIEALPPSWLKRLEDLKFACIGELTPTAAE